ncbi:MAG TPA: SIR2 family protein [Kofleriaceae bacterium]
MPLYREFRLITHALSPEQAAQLARAVQHFHGAQNALKLVPAGERALRVQAKRVDFRDLLRAPPPESPEIVVTSVGLLDNWFTHVRIDRALLNISQWEMAFGNDPTMPTAAPDAYILASLALTSFVLCCRGADYDYLHEDTTGCLMDLCENKAERAIKMRSGYICAACQTRAAAAGVSPVEIDAIQAIIDQVRLLTLGRSPQALRPTPAPDSEDAFLRDATLPPEVKLPASLLGACLERGLTVFVGSGLSMQADVAVEYREPLTWRALPRWLEVSERLSASVKRYRARDHAPRTAETLDEYLTDLDFFRTALGERAYYPRAIFDIFAPHVRDPGRANRLVFRLPLRWVVTTNYDFVLNFAAPPGTPVYTWREARQAREYLALGGTRAPLLKIHGCASRPDTVVLTRSEYRAMRASEEYVALMKFVFDVQASLFIGFGFTDPFDLDLALEQAQAAGAAQGEKFALIPSDNARAIRERFGNVQVIAYERHEDLARILAVLARETAPLAGPHGP